VEEARAQRRNQGTSNASSPNISSRVCVPNADKLHVGSPNAFPFSGQQYNDELHEEEEVPSEMAKRVEELLERYRKYIGFLIPCLFMQVSFILSEPYFY